MRSVLAGVCGLVLSSSAGAQQPLVTSMTPEELTGCGVLALDLAQRHAAMKATDATLTTRAKALRIESDAIDAARRRVNLKDPKAVAAFNARLTRSAKALAAYNALAKASAPDVAKLNRQSGTFNVQCAQRPYSNEDLAKLAPALREAMEAVSRQTEVAFLPPSTSLREDAAVPVAAPNPVEVLRKKAEGGDAAAQVELGERMRWGKGVPRDPAGALGWFLKAAENKSTRGAFAASDMLREGADVPIDKAKGLALLRQAAEGGDADAQHNLALVLEAESRTGDRMRQARDWMTRAAAQGDPESQYVLAGYLRGGPGLPADDAGALKWLRLSADQGFRPAQLTLGEAMEKGKGVERDRVEALKWYRLAAGRTKTDPSQGCTRRLLIDSNTRTKAGAAADALAAKLPPYDADRAAAAAEAWVASVKARSVGGCPKVS